LISLGNRKPDGCATDPEAFIGKSSDIVAHVANTLAAFGDSLAAGGVIMTGSTTPPLMIDADETELTHVLGPIARISVGFSCNQHRLGYSQNRQGRPIYVG
jgi:2-keto-4-pentenoate hydratase